MNRLSNHFLYPVLVLPGCLLCLSTGLSASNSPPGQVPPRAQHSFRRTFGGPGMDEGRAVQQTSDGGYIIAGVSTSYEEGAWRMWLVRVSPGGEQAWSRGYGSSLYEEAESVQQVGDGGFILAGTGRASGPGDYDLRLVRTDTEGRELWRRTFGGKGWDWGRCVRPTPDGGFIVAGWTDSFGGGDGDAWLVRTNREGREEWNRTYGGIDNDQARCVHPTPDGGFVFTGSTVSYSVGQDDLWLVRTDGEGVMQWSRTLGGEGYDEGLFVEPVMDGGFIVLGSTTTYGAGAGDLWLIKFTNAGNVEWIRTFGGEGWDWGGEVHQTPDGGYILIGSTLSYGAGGSDAWLIKTDREGREEWNRTYGGHDLDFGLSVQPTSDGGYIIAARTYSYGAGDSDLWLIKTDSQGLAVY